MTDKKAALRSLITQYEARQRRQMGIAILAGTTVLALAVFLAPKPAPEPVEVAVEEGAPAVDAYEDLALSGKAAIVYDLATGEVLFERNAKAQLPLASLTKLLTVYAAATSMPRDARVTLTDAALAADGESGFAAGETFTLDDLAKLALVSSSNDATEAIALATESHRAQSGPTLLASAAAAIGLSQTYALNGTGLDESTSVSGGYGSATDVAKLAGALLGAAPEIARASTEPALTIHSTTGVAHTLSNTNPDVVRVPGIMLSKTGFTDLAGGNLVVVYDAGIGHPVAVVVMGSTREGRFTDVAKLIKRTADHFAGL
ncbi:MAG TPA: serine hydrolase [Candidatus Paceibacterota bacterium]|nr:serine hydrolase [Candidatus Paceibacterota bacterium]